MRKLWTTMSDFKHFTISTCWFRIHLLLCTNHPKLKLRMSYGLCQFAKSTKNSPHKWWTHNTSTFDSTSEVYRVSFVIDKERMGGELRTWGKRRKRTKERYRESRRRREQKTERKRLGKRLQVGNEIKRRNSFTCTCGRLHSLVLKNMDWFKKRFCWYSTIVV